MTMEKRSASIVRGRLTSRFVNSVSTPGKYHDKSNIGLFLYVRKGGSKQFIQRIMYNNRRRELGLGAPPVITLQRARDLALQNKRKVLEGYDPTEDKARQKQCPTFESAAKTVVQSLWKKKDVKYVKQFESTLRLHVIPEIGFKKVDQISNSDIIHLVNKISSEKPSVAKTAKTYMTAVFKWCFVMEYTKSNPVISSREAFDKANYKVKPRASLPYQECHSFIQNLREYDAWIGVRLIIEFLILTAKRSGEARKAQWKEIDKISGVWNIPGSHTKDKKNRIEPLSERALEILEEMRKFSGKVLPDDVIFKSERKGGVIDRKTLSRFVKRDLGYDVDIHGFRTSFRTWTQEKTSFSDEVCEMILSHSTGNEVRDAYARSPLLVERHRVICAWAKFLESSPDR